MYKVKARCKTLSGLSVLQIDGCSVGGRKVFFLS